MGAEMTKDEALKLALEALENNRQTHNYCEDTWYSCPKHEEGCANESEGDECNCGADNVNAQFDKAIIAIKKALAQPEFVLNGVDCSCGRKWRVVNNTLTASEQPEQESDDLTIAYMAGFHAGKNKDALQRKPDQEPVAMRYDFDGYGWLYIDNGSGSNWKEKIKNAEPLYTTPPKRKWVGLTEEERDHFEGLHLYAARNQVEAWIEGVPAFIDAIEAKLREKNGC